MTSGLQHVLVSSRFLPPSPLRVGVQVCRIVWVQDDDLRVWGFRGLGVSGLGVRV